MRITVFSFGKLKTAGLRESADYYLKLISPWNSIDECELKPSHVPEKSPATRAIIQEKEAEILKAKLDSVLGSRGAYFILDERGKNMPTKAWAELVREIRDSSIPHLGFCVGSSLGFGDLIRKNARGTLSLGAQTTSHELARVMLFEQVYRALSIGRGHPYHNED